MKTAIEIAEKEIAELWSSPSDQPTYTQIFKVLVRVKRTEKQQHEQTAIHITNVLMDALDNPKVGKFSGEDEFNKYWENTFTTNKETLK